MNNILNSIPQMDKPDLLNALSEKLQVANKTVILEKRREREEIQQKLQNIETMFSGKKKFQTEALEKAKFSVQKAATFSNETIKNMNLKTRKQEQLLRNFKEQIQNGLEQCERDHQQKIEEVIERQTDKMTETIEQLTKKAKHISEANQKSLLELNRTILNLEKELEDETEQRKNNCKQIEEDIAAEVTKFNIMIQKEREHRIVSEQKIQGMIEEIKSKIVSQTETASMKRKKNNAALLKLIEGACHRLEEKINYVI